MILKGKKHFLIKKNNNNRSSYSVYEKYIYGIYYIMQYDITKWRLEIKTLTSKEVFYVFHARQSQTYRCSLCKLIVI